MVVVFSETVVTDGGSVLTKNRRMVIEGHEGQKQYVCMAKSHHSRVVIKPLSS